MRRGEAPSLGERREAEGAVRRRLLDLPRSRLPPRPQARRPQAGASNAVLNDSQIASIKKRLSLTPEQERYWPAVEAELRKMEYKKDRRASRRRALAWRRST